METYNVNEIYRILQSNGCLKGAQCPTTENIRDKTCGTHQKHEHELFNGERSWHTSWSCG